LGVGQSRFWRDTLSGLYRIAQAGLAASV